jgi:ubiquinone/menaquinone biosynthesis C-methylase UbiE
MSLTKEEIAKGYDAIVDKVGLEPRFYEDCLNMHSSYHGAILDVGCGRGFLLKQLRGRAHAGSTFFGVDISQKLCDIAKANNPEAQITVGDAEALPYEDNSFDFVFMTEALEHMLSFDKALSEVGRVLRPGGVFIVTVPNRDWASYDFYDKMRNHELQPIDDHYFRFEEISGLLRSHSFKIITYRGLDNLWYYGWKHKIEEVAALFFPPLNKKMKRLIFKTTNSK